MVRERSSHHAILMHDGRVFIMGGEGASSEGASAEIYDPKTGKFTFIGNMNEGVYYKPILLPNNQILLVCTRYVGNYKIPHSEIFDPATNKFINVDKLHYLKMNPIITLLPNGKVLIAGVDGVSTDINYYRAELYDPITRKFTLIDKMLYPESGTAVQLKNGNVLIYGIGSYNNKDIAIEAEIYDYKKNKFIRTKNDLDAPCYLGAIALKNDKVLLVDSKKHIVEIYEAKTNSFHQIKYMNIPRLFPKMLLLSDGKVLITGGSHKDIGAYQITQAEIFDPSTETFTLAGEMTRFGFLNSEPRGGYISTLLPSGKVLITGGYVGQYNYTRATNAIEIYNPKTGKFTKFKMRAVRSSYTQTLLQDGSVLITGGDGDKGHLNTAEIYKDKPCRLYAGVNEEK